MQLELDQQININVFMTQFICNLDTIICNSDVIQIQFGCNLQWNDCSEDNSGGYSHDFNIAFHFFLATVVDVE